MYFSRKFVTRKYPGLHNDIKIYLYYKSKLYSAVALTPTGLTAVQVGPTGIRVSWTPPTPLEDTTGYRIYYSDGSSGYDDIDSSGYYSDGNSGIVNVTGGSTHNHLLTGLQNGATYNISIVGTSNHLHSDQMDIRKNIPLSEFFNVTLLVIPLKYYFSLLHIDSSWPINCNYGLHNIYYHFPLLDYTQW